MTTANIERLIGAVPWDAVVVALLHSLWQGAAWAVAVWLVLRWLAARHVNVRYAIAVGGIVGVLLSTMGTFQVLTSAERRIERPADLAVTPAIMQTSAAVSAADGVRVSEPSAKGQATAITAAGVGTPLQARASRTKNLWAYAAAFWLCGTALMLARAGWMMRGATRLRRRCVAITDGPLADAVEQLRRSMRIARRVRVAAGTHVRVPAVCGVLWPVVLVPVALANELSVAQVRMILAHELAHVRRHDYLVNLLQLLVEAFLFFNPAVWWLSRQVRVEREACCDAAAIRATGGRETDYVQSLADVMANLMNAGGANQPGLGLAPAASGGAGGGGRGGGGLLDRAARVLRPAQRPPVRLSWYSLIGATLAAAVLLAGMWRGTQAAVDVAQRLLSPAERVERMAELKAELGERSEPVEQKEADYVELAGTVRTADGAPFPRDTHVTAHVRDGHRYSSHSLVLAKDGRFKHKVPAGEAVVHVGSDGYAPAFSELVKASPAAAGKPPAYPPVDLVIDRGFDGVVRVSDAGDGKPVAGVAVKLEYRIYPDGSSYMAGRAATTDAAGRAAFPNASTRPVRLTVDHPGYQLEQAPLEMALGRPSELPLRRAAATTGVVIDAATRKPIAGATVRLLQRDGFANQNWYPNHTLTRSVEPPLLATTDAVGRFSLTTLRDDCTYAMWVSAAGHGSELKTAVRAGSTDLEWALGPSRAIQIEVHADAGKMPKYVGVSNPLLLGNSSSTYVFNLTPAIEDGVGMCEFPDPIPGTVRFSADGVQASTHVPRAASAGPVVLDLRKAAAAAATQPLATREVVVKVGRPEDGAEVKGKLRVDVHADGPRGYTQQWAELKDGQARLTVPVPSKLQYSQGDVVGYWIDERYNIEVTEGDEPFEIEAQASPAGALHGMVTDEQGRPFTEYFYASLQTVEKSADVGPNSRPPSDNGYNHNDRTGRFLLSPLPLGGTYRVVVSAKGRFAASEPIALAADAPIREVNFKLAEGLAVAGRVVGPGGTPPGGVGVRLQFTLGTGGYGAEAKTDRDGRFRFEHVDPDAPGEYSLLVSPGEQTAGLRVAPIAVDGNPVDVQVAAGLTARGKFVDAETGQPMRGIRVTLSPGTITSFDQQGAKYTSAIETTTNDRGEFEARGLEPISYRVQSHDTYPAGATVIRDATGKAVSVRFSGNDEVHVVTGGQPEPVEIRRMRSPFR